MANTTPENGGENMPRLKFFEPGGTLSRNSPCYVRRQADDTLINALRAHEYCYVLDSRQKGKSSLMVRIASTLKDEGFQTVLLDLQGRGSNLTLEQWYAGMLTRFGDELEDRSSLLRYWQANQHLGPLDRFFKAIEEVVLPTVKDGLVVFVDEVDFVRSLPFPTDEFFGGIRHFFNLRANNPRFEKLSFVLIGTANPIELIADPHLTPFNIGRRIELQDFKFEECEPLRKGLNEDPQIAADLMKRILFWTSGHPYLTQRLCEMVWVENGITRPSDIDRIVAQIFLSVEAQTSEPNLHDVGRRVAESMPADVEPSEYFQRVHEIYGQLLKGKTVADSQQDTVISHLKLAGLLSGRDGRLFIRTRIYKEVFDATWLEALRSADDEHGTPRKKSWLEGKMVRRIGAGALVAIVLVFVTYRLAWSLGQPNFSTSATEVVPGGSIAITGENVKALDAVIHDERDHEIFLPLTREDGVLTAHFPRSTPPGRYALRLRRAPFLGFLPFGLSERATHVLVADERPLALVGHTALVTTAVFSPDGSHIVTASGDNTARIWNTADGHGIRDLRGHKDMVLSAFYSSDGKRILTSSWDRTAKIWNAVTGKEQVRLSGHKDKVVFANFSPNGKLVVTASMDNTARIWDAASGKQLQVLFGDRGQVKCATFSPDNKSVATASFDGTLRFWDVSTGKEFSRLKGLTALPFYVSYSPDGTKIVIGTQDNTASIWDLKSGRRLTKLVGHTGWVVFAAFSPDGERIATGSADKTARIWDAASGKSLFVLGGHKDRVNTAFFSPDGSRVATASFDHTVRLWNAKTGQPMAKPVE